VAWELEKGEESNYWIPEGGHLDNKLGHLCFSGADDP
jgi:hypothetical protein